MSQNQANPIVCKVQTEDFDLAQQYRFLQNAGSGQGAIVTFSGIVRDKQANKAIRALYLEHYPAMTNKALMTIIHSAIERWPLGAVSVIHRVGYLEANEQIVFVGVTSQHRKAAFEGCEYIMDVLKTSAPLWKKEIYHDSEHWVEAKSSDQDALKKWTCAKSG